MTKKTESGPFAVAFAWIGGIAGAVGGYEAGGGPGMFGTAVVLALVGFFVGQVADAILKWAIFLATCVVVILVNTAVRRFAWELITAMFG